MVCYTCIVIRLYIVFILFVVSSTQLLAQIPNASFERIDSIGKTQIWETSQGTIVRKSIEQFGSLPFSASDGNFFLKLSSDTSGTFPEKAKLKATFALAETIKSFYFDYLYITPTKSNNGLFTLLFTKWNEVSRDTILFLNDSISPVVSGNQIPIQWNSKGVNLTLLSMADSVTISFSNELLQTQSSTQILFIDNLIFKPWPLGMLEDHGLSFNIYPNPTCDKLFFNGNFIQANITIIDANGKQLVTQSISYELNTVNIGYLPQGLYTVQFTATKDGKYLPPVYRKIIKLK